MREPIRQGDVLLVPVGKLPGNAKAKGRKGRVVVALGEATGHSHVLERSARLYITEEEIERRFIEITAPTNLVHDEHDTIAVAPGVYEQLPQMEYTPEELRRVAD